MPSFTTNKDFRTKGRYIIASGLSFILTLGFSYLFVNLFAFEEHIGVALTQATMMVVNFIVIRSFVFQSQGGVISQFFKFITSSLIFRAAEYGLFLLLFTVLPLSYLVSLSIALVLSFALKYITQRQLIFN